MRDTSFYRDIYTDLYITFGGLFSKRVVQSYLSDSNFNKKRAKWETIKSKILDSVNTHDEVNERQPILAELFNELKLGKDINPLRTEGDLLLRDFIVEVKQPSSLSISAYRGSSESEETNDEQLLRAMKARKKDWGILTNGSEWQFVYIHEVENSFISIPFISFSLLDMIKDEANAQDHICLFIDLLTSREVRSHLINKTRETRAISTTSFKEQILETKSYCLDLDLKEQDFSKILELVFYLTYLFYAEDIGALPRRSKEYSKYDIRLHISKDGVINTEIIIAALKRFSEQYWSVTKIKSSGNASFFNGELETFIKKNKSVINKIFLNKIWLDKDNNEFDLSEISSSDLCDVYQHCISFDDEETVGTVYTNKGLSDYVNYQITHNFVGTLQDGDIVLDPACGSGHLLKRSLFLASKLIGPKKFNSKTEMIEHFCTNHLAGIDKNPIATLITKINIWLSCTAPGRSLPILSKVICDNTLKRYETSFNEKGFQKSIFLNDLGSRVKLILSNPPWSMIQGEHPEKWISESSVWKSQKTKICTGKNNIALNFLHLIHEVAVKDGIGIIVLPGVFFVGSDSVIRDQLMPEISSYMPSIKNSDFEKIDNSQNYGIIAFTKGKKTPEKKVYFRGLDNNKFKSYKLSDEIIFSPLNRKKLLNTLASKFSANTLLPLFGRIDQLLVFSNLLNLTKPADAWTKGKNGLAIGGEHLTTKSSNAPTGYIGTPENRGNSKQAISLNYLSKRDFDNCNHKVLKANLTALPLPPKEFGEFLMTPEFNEVLGTLRTSKSIQSATLNFLGCPGDLQAYRQVKGIIIKLKAIRLDAVNELAKKRKKEAV